MGFREIVRAEAPACTLGAGHASGRAPFRRRRRRAIGACMPDGLALPTIALAAIGLVALGLVWPQGEGAPSPAPFGRPVAGIPAPVLQVMKDRAVRAEARALPLTHALTSSLRGPESAQKPPAVAKP